MSIPTPNVQLFLTVRPLVKSIENKCYLIFKRKFGRESMHRADCILFNIRHNVNQFFEM